jgi:DNA-binding transcriptional LysR family regulator
MISAVPISVADAGGMLTAMDPHLLRTYVTVVRLASFSEAARELGYTQSAVSQHIAALEQDLGARLLTRRPVAPTAVGERLLEHAGPLLLRLEAARADVARTAAAPEHGLTLAAAPTALGPGVVAALPAAGTTLRVLARDEVPAAVATGAADLGLVDGLAAPSDPLRLPDVAPLTTRGVAEEPVRVLLPAAHPLAGRPALRLGDLADARWLDAPDAGLPLAQLRAANAGHGFRPSLRYDGTDVRTLTALAAAGSRARP